MIKLNRTTEYGLMALRHMDRKQVTDPYEVTSAREIADTYGLPFEITAKTLQRLKDVGLIQSAQGARGGYMLQKALTEVTLAEFVRLMEGPCQLVPCADKQPFEKAADTPCEYHSRCEIHQLMNHLNARIYSFLSGIRLAEFSQQAVPLSSVAKVQAFATVAGGEEP